MPTTNDHDQPVGDPVPGWDPRERPRPVTLVGRHVTLEPLAAEHAEPLHDALCGPGDDALWTYRPDDPPPDVAAAARWVAARAASREQVTLVLVPRGGTAAGMLSLARIEPDHGVLEVAAVIFARSLQRTTAATEAVHLVLRHVLDDLGYRRVEWKCDSLNEPSRRAAARLGFTYEGRFRRHLVVKGRNRDTDWFSLTDTDWPAVREAQERWLDPANLDEDGAQRVALGELLAQGR